MKLLTCSLHGLYNVECFNYLLSTVVHTNILYAEILKLVSTHLNYRLRPFSVILFSLYAPITSDECCLWCTVSRAVGNAEQAKIYKMKIHEMKHDIHPRFELRWVVVKRHIQRYFSFICNGTDVHYRQYVHRKNNNIKENGSAVEQWVHSSFKPGSLHCQTLQRMNYIRTSQNTGKFFLYRPYM